MTSYKHSLAILLLLVSPFSLAGGWSNFTTVFEVYPNQSGTVYIKLTDSQNLDDCEYGSYLMIKSDNQAQDKIYAGSLSALAANQQVSYYMSGCDPYPVILNLRIRAPLQ